MEEVKIDEQAKAQTPPAENPETLTDAFDEFEKYTTDLKAVNVEEAKKDGSVATTPDLSYQVKVHFFVGIFLTLVSGVHVIVVNLFAKMDLTLEDLRFEDHEKAALTPYFNSPKIVELLNKLPDWVLLVAQMEFFMVNKISRVVKQKKEQKRLKEESDER